MLKKIIDVRGVIGFYILIVLGIVLINARIGALNNKPNERSEIALCGSDLINK